MLPSCISALPLDFNQLSGLNEVIADINSVSWSNVPPYFSVKKGSVRGCPMSFIYLGDEKFCIKISKTICKGAYKHRKDAILWDRSTRTASLVCVVCDHQPGKLAISPFVKTYAVIHEPPFNKRKIVQERFEMDLFTLFEDPNRVDDIPFLLRIYMCQQLTAQVAQLHKSGIIHNDIKHENILFRRCGVEVKLIDFDFQTHADNVDETILGTLEMQPPEFWVDRYTGSRLSLQHKKQKDVWALGMVLASIISPLDPLAWDSLGGNMENLFKQIKKAPYPLPYPLYKQLMDYYLKPFPFENAGIYGIVSKMLTFYPENRISAEDALKAITKLATHVN